MGLRKANKFTLKAWGDGEAMVNLHFLMLTTKNSGPEIREKNLMTEPE